MNLNYQHLLPQDFNEDSRVWIYQCNRVFTLSEVLDIEAMVQEFAANWKSHQVPVKGFATVFFGQFIVLMADETATGVSGCSTDSSVRLMKQIEQQFNVQLFDRQLLAFVVKDKVQVLPMSQLPYAFNNQFITTDTLYFNNLVATKKELTTQWLLPVKDSWVGKRFATNATAS
jgi:hypothetical protein